MIKEIQTKSILSPLKTGADDFFGTRYSMNLYRGCQHNCIYCDSRSTCYHINNFSEIEVKINALELLENELKSKRNKGTIGFGSMNDCYMPVEKEKGLTRKALEVIERHHFPVHIITKSSLVCRDIDLLQSLSKIYAAVSITITTSDDKLAKIIEPGAPSPSERFATIKELSKAGIYCGITLMPVLPYITDSPENISSIIEKASISKAQYVLGYMGMTIREGQREYFYAMLDKHFPGLKDKYFRQYGMSYGCQVPDYMKLTNLFKNKCKQLNIPIRMRFYEPHLPVQGKLF